MTGDPVFETLHGCVLVRKAPGTTGVPLDTFEKISSMLPSQGKGAVLDTDLARILDALLVVGLPKDLERLRTAPETLASGQQLADSLPPYMSGAARRWAVWGEQGRSSQTMFRELTGVIPVGASTNETSHPYDVSDFRRCLLLAEQVPEIRRRLPELSGLSDAWRSLVSQWDAIAAAFEADMPNWRASDGPYPERVNTMVRDAIGAGET